MPVDPSRQQLEEISARAAADDSPVVMLNLNRYADREEYLRYGAVATGVLERLGAKILWHADAAETVIGTDDDSYDEVIAVWYPNRAAFIALATDPEVMEALEHRRAGLESAAIICCESGPDAVLAGL